ncbi:hypothetical protein SDC9_156709 [bioreactor metagenome]|uniref:Uncharacterized protein n=1 Tax=bioreactor metagenome TaxID=1076179 RepID=A0A645F7U1_9ZZZZ
MFKEGVDNGGRHIPPDGETYIDSVVLSHVFDKVRYGRSERLVVHLDAGSAFLVCPVKIGRAVRLFGFDLKNVCADSGRQIFC